MEFENRLKGNIAQSLFETLLGDVYYRIVPLGIEEIIREVRSLDSQTYNDLGLSPTLRKLPDFFVAGPDFQSTHLVEVKYRQKWSNAVRDRIGNDIKDQVQQWQPLTLVIFLGNKARPKNTPASFLGVCKLVIKNGDLQLVYRNPSNFSQLALLDKYIPWSQVTWDHMNRFQDVFSEVGERWEESTLTKAIDMVKNLELPEETSDVELKYKAK